MVPNSLSDFDFYTLLLLTASGSFYLLIHRMLDKRLPWCLRIGVFWSFYFLRRNIF